MDELMPNWVKDTYSPKESWKGKPFGRQDALFFLKGVKDLSELFTDERPSEMPSYFQHPKFRSSYLLYFLPLQAAKFSALFELHPKAMDAALAHAKKTGTLRVLDLGSGPGTASIALLLWLMDHASRTGDEVPRVQLDWVDMSRAILEDGKRLVERLTEAFPKLRGKVEVRLHVSQWWRVAATYSEKTSLLLLGNVLNESRLELPKIDQDLEDEMDALPGKETAPAVGTLLRLIAAAEGGGTLMVEPAFKRASQLLSQIRDVVIWSGSVKKTQSSIWGPCPHAERCPLATGRDWCHFSVPAEIPGEWFRFLSKGLGSERHWIKFSYVWFTGKDQKAPEIPAGLRRVVSDPIRSKSAPTTVLLCEPVTPRRFQIPASARVFRGDLIRVDRAPPRVPPRSPTTRRAPSPARKHSKKR